MEESDCSVSISNLICQEDGTDLDAGDGEEEYYYTKFILLNDSSLTETEEYIEKLVSRETSFNSRCYDLSSCSEFSVAADGWFKSARSAAVRWILKTGARFGFSPRTAYLALSYFDQFFARRSIDKEKPWAVRLLSIACLSLAAKMEEYTAPALSEYQTEEYGFDSSSIRRMELFVLSTLAWRTSLVTPFDYLSYFAYKFHHQHGSKDLLYEAIGFIFVTLEVINLVDHRPSAIAVAAILAASGERLTKELVESKMSTTSLSGALEIEHVFSCYSVMTQESYKKLKISTRPTSSHLSTNCSSINDVVDVIDSASFIAPSNKRRRLHLPDII